MRWFADQHAGNRDDGLGELHCDLLRYHVAAPVRRGFRNGDNFRAD
jgi:hypothetical protein